MAGSLNLIQIPDGLDRTFRKVVSVGLEALGRAAQTHPELTDEDAGDLLKTAAGHVCAKAARHAVPAELVVSLGVRTFCLARLFNHADEGWMQSHIDAVTGGFNLSDALFTGARVCNVVRDDDGKPGFDIPDLRERLDSMAIAGATRGVVQH